MEPRLYDDTHERMCSRDKKRTEISVADTGGINGVKERACAAGVELAAVTVGCQLSLSRKLASGARVRLGGT